MYLFIPQRTSVNAKDWLVGQPALKVRALSAGTTELYVSTEEDSVKAYRGVSVSVRQRRA